MGTSKEITNEPVTRTELENGIVREIQSANYKDLVFVYHYLKADPKHSKSK